MTLKYFGESYLYRDEKEKEDGKNYLILWKNNLIRKLHRDSFTCEFVSEDWFDRPDSCVGIQNYLGLKVCLKGKWNYELD